MGSLLRKYSNKYTQDRRIIVDRSLLGSESKFINQEVLDTDILVEYLSIEDAKLELMISFIPKETFAKTCDDNTMQKFAVDGYNRISLGLRECFDDTNYILNKRINLTKKFFTLVFSRQLKIRDGGLKGAMLIIKNIIASWSFGVLSFEVSLGNVPRIGDYKRFVFFSNPKIEIENDFYACDEEFDQFAHLVDNNDEELTLYFLHCPLREREDSIENVALLYRICYYFDELISLFRKLRSRSLAENDSRSITLGRTIVKYVTEFRGIETSDYDLFAGLVVPSEATIISTGMTFADVRIYHLKSVFSSIARYPQG